MPLRQLFRSSVGRKTVMALSGLILFGFVVAHLLGNLLIFVGPEALNAYAVKLRTLGPMLWIVRLVLLASVLLHIETSVRLTIENRKARPQPYAVYRSGETTFAARTMMVSGVLLLAYLIYHLLHFTFRLVHPECSNTTDALGHHDVYQMAVLSFQQWPIVLAYLVGVWAVCVHLSHGIGSSPQTLGLNNEHTLSLFRWLGRLMAGAIFVGYASIPLSVLLGVVRLR